MSYRSHAAGSLRLSHVGQLVQLAGWAQAIRRFKTQAFVELRESSGLVQLVIPSSLVGPLTEESSLTVTGRVVARRQVHPNLSQYPTGKIEVVVETIEMLGAAQALPFARHETPQEEQMLRHRPLALRWPQHQAPLRARAAAVSAMRHVAEAHGFLEVETPVLVRETPGGAAPFRVPMGQGKSYTLAQSPQVWKQLLVCGGIERYYQLAHCFRNEGARPERQPEFSQFEIEMAFVRAHEVQAVMEQMVQAAASACGVSLPGQFARLTYFEALARFGSEKPHLGVSWELLGPVATPCTRFEVSEVTLPLPRALTRPEQGQWMKRAWELVGEQGEAICPMGSQAITLRGPLETMQLALGRLRLELAQAWGAISQGVFPVWVEAFPLWEKTEQGQWTSAHHPFTRPHPHSQLSWEQPESMLAEAFDLVMNGQEVGGGSMRIHEPQLQQQVFEFLSIPAAHAHFRPLLEALSLGPPPHGGMALGVERLLATLLGLPHIRAVMAFPKTTGGQCLLTEALS